MLHALGRRTSPRTPSSTPIGRAHDRFKVAYNALVATSNTADGALREEACISKSSRAALQAVSAEKPTAGRITPMKLAGLSELLLLPITRVEQLLQSSPPTVQQMEPHQVAQRLKDLCRTLGLRPKQAAFMVLKQPAYMLLTPLEDIRTKVLELADVLGVPPAAVLRTALTVPSILRRKVATVQRRVEAYSALLQCSPVDVLHVMARGPEYLSDTPSSVRQRMMALGYILRRPRCTIAAMLQARPDLVCISGKVMNSKVNGLMCILNKQKRHVVTLLVKVPALLRCDLDRARHAFEGLQALLQKREGFVYAMICHAPNLLLMPPRGMHQRCAALRRCLSASPEWQQEFQQLRPPGVAQLLLNRQGCLSAMMFLADRRQAGVISLAQLLAKGPGGGPVQALGESWPDFQGWMERRRHYMAVRAQQWRAGILGAAMAQQGAVAAGQAVPRLGAAQGVGVGAGLATALVPHQQHQQPLATSPLSVTIAAAAGILEAVDETFRHIGEGGSVPLRHAGAPPLVGSFCGAREDGHMEAGANGGGASCSDEGSTSTCIGSGCQGMSREERSENESFVPQDSVNVAVGDRRQQPEASTSGRQPSWLQLQAEYRRGLKARSGKASSKLIKRIGPAIGATASAAAWPAPGNRARRRRKAAASAAAASAAAASPAAASAAAASAAAAEDVLGAEGPFATGSTENGGTIPPLSSQLFQDCTAPYPAERGAQTLGPAVADERVFTVALARVGMQEDAVDAPHCGAAFSNQNGKPPEAPGAGVAGGGSPSTIAARGHELVRTEEGFQDARDGTIWQHAQTRRPQRHILSSLLVPGRGLGATAEVRQSQPTGDASPGGSHNVGVSETFESSQAPAHALSHAGHLRAPVLAQHPGTGHDVGHTGESMSSVVSSCQRTGALGSVCGPEDVGEGPSSHAFAATRPIPVWIQVNGAGDVDGGGTGEGSGGGDCLTHLGEAPQVVHFADANGQEFVRHSSPASQVDSNGSLIVVKGDGALCDLAGVGRESHHRGRHGQRRAAVVQQGLNPGQVLESALRVPSPR